MISEWDPIFRSNLKEYANMRLNEDMVELVFENCKEFTIFFDIRAVPQMIKILQRMEKHLEQDT